MTGNRRWLVAFATIGLLAPAARGGEWSPEYRASLQRSAERRRQRRREGREPVGKIVPYPMPPALIIRHTPEVHDEVRDFLRLLRGGY